MGLINFFQQNNNNSSAFYESTKSQHRAYPESAKLNRDFHSHNWRTHRPHAGGFFSSVEYVVRGFVPGSRGLQDGANRNKRVAYQLGNGRTRTFLPTSKKLTGATPMQTAITTGAVRPYPGQITLPAFSKPADDQFQFPESDLQYSDTQTGVLVTHAGLLVAWLYQGHARSRNNPKRCNFWDVAFPSLTFGQQNRITGVMLDSDSFDSLADAVQFVESTFASEVA